MDLVITGADRIARKGDIANIIVIYGLAVLARAHKIPFYVPATRSLFYMSMIPIEEKPADEIRIRTFFCDLGLQ